MEGFGHHGWGMIWWWIIGLIILILLVWLIVRSSERGGGPVASPKKSAMDILKERYARGEISKEEYDSRKKDLM